MFAWSITAASRTGIQRHELLAGILLIHSLASSVAAATAAEAATHEHVIRVPSNDRLTHDHLQRAIGESATARELVSRIERLQNTVLIVRAHPLLVRQERLLGRGKFWVVRRRLFGLLEYQAEPVGCDRAVRILAHELAHALEVAVMPRGFDTNSLRSLVVTREGQEGSAPAGIETDFADVIALVPPAATSKTMKCVGVTCLYWVGSPGPLGSVSAPCFASATFQVPTSAAGEHALPGRLVGVDA